MRGLRSTIALVVVLLGLGAYIYFVTWEQPDGGAEAPRDNVFAALESDKIDEIKVKSESGETTTLKKEGDAWQMTSPLMTKADANEVSSITSNLASLAITRVVDENAPDLKEYGLDAPRMEIEFKASGDKDYGEFRRLLIGSKSATGELFAKRENEPRVLLIPGYLDSVFNRSTFNLRDKALLTFERDKVDRITVSTGGQTLELAKTGTDWKLTKPVSAAADTVSVDGLINRLNTVQMKSIVADQAAPAELGKYGLDKPQASVAVTTGSSTASLFVGGRTGEELYVRDASRPLVATVEGSLLTDLQKGADEYRRKDILAFRGYSGDRLEFMREGQTVVFEKVTTEGQPDKWRRTSPNAGEPEAMNMDSLLSKLEGLRAASFRPSTAGTGLDKPAVTIYARSEDGKKEERVALARAPSGTDGYAAIPDQPGAAVISGTAYDELISALDLVSK
jgi:hypothetical protein